MLQPTTRHTFRILLILGIISPKWVASSLADTNSPYSNNLVPSFQPDEAGPRHKHLGFLDDNGSNVARLVETTTSGGWTTECKGGDVETTQEHQVSLKDSTPLRRSTNYHVKASICTILLAIAWSPLLSTILPGLQALDLRIFRTIATFLYLLECMLSSTRKYLSNSFSPAGFMDYVASLQQAAPQIIWDVECYHYSMVYRQERGKVRAATSREKRVTHRARMPFDIATWRDVTSLETLSRAVQIHNEKDALPTTFSLKDSSPTTTPTTFLKLSLNKLFVLTNPSIQERYFAQERMFQEREGRRDAHHDFNRYLHFHGDDGKNTKSKFRHKVLVVRTGLSDIALASSLWFWMASLVGMTVPYRIWCSRHCQSAELTITKELVD